MGWDTYTGMYCIRFLSLRYEYAIPPMFLPRW